MKIFIDSASPQDVEKTLATGLVDGITTNPTLIARSGRPHEDVIKDLCALTSLPISAEVTCNTRAGMVEEGLKLSEIGSQVVIKIPLTVEGLGACHELVFHHNLKTNVTLCFSPLQALLAAKAGATYVSPFVGRLNEIGHSGTLLIQEIVQLFNVHHLNSTAVLAASMRSVQDVLDAALAGASHATITPTLFWQLYKHPLTDRGLEQFLQDAAKKDYVE